MCFVLDRSSTGKAIRQGCRTLQLVTYGRRYEPYGLYARLSNDNGKTWSNTSWLLRKAPKPFYLDVKTA